MFDIFHEDGSLMIRNESEYYEFPLFVREDNSGQSLNHRCG